LTESLDAFVLCGGRSRRMGEDKALVDLGGRPLIARPIDACLDVARRVVLVTDAPELYRRFGLESVGDRWPDSGSIGGIGTAIWKSHTARTIVVGCDLPFVTGRFLGWLAGRDAGADVTVCATADGELHPLAAIYSRECLKAIGRAVGARKLKVTRFFDEVIVRTVGADERAAAGFPAEVLLNVNTREDLERARRILASGQQLPAAERSPAAKTKRTRTAAKRSPPSLLPS
jgi:molybdopterin-guanine dinucleotide biosynthesis protein A